MRAGLRVVCTLVAAVVLPFLSRSHYTIDIVVSVLLAYSAMLYGVG